MVGIIGPWNFPFNLTIGEASGLIALIDRMVRLIIDPANPQTARNTRKKKRNKRA